MLLKFCAVVLCSWIFIFSLTDGKHKGPKHCGDIFNATSGTITNDSLHPSCSCSYNILPNKTNSTHPIKILLKKLILDKNDNVTIAIFNDSKIIFSAFHGQNEAIPLITNETELTVTIETSDVFMTRHFEFYYDSTSPECTFKIDNDIQTVQETVSYDNSTSTCKLIYTANSVTPFKHSFTFDIFNLTSKSSISAEDLMNPIREFSENASLQELFASKTITIFTVKINPGDHLILRQHHLNPNCSGFFEISDSEDLVSSSSLKLDNGSLILNCRWLIKNKNQDKSLGFHLNSINLTHPYDVVVLSDGSTFNSPALYQITSSNIATTSDEVLMSSGEFMTVSFKYNSVSSRFNASVANADQGKLVKNEGVIHLQPSEKTNTFLIEVNETQNVILDFENSDIKDAMLEIYDDFHYKSKLIASLHGALWYPVSSTTNRMMIVATNFGHNGFDAKFKGFSVGCVKMSQGTSDNSYILSKNCNTTCQWIIAPINLINTDLILDLQFLALEDDDKITILRLNDAKTVITTITSNITHIPQMMLNAEEGALVKIERGLCTKKPEDVILVAQATYLPKCSGIVTLPTSQTVHLTSPGFPNTYPLLASCENSINTSISNTLIHVAVDKLQLAPNHCLTLSDGSSAGKVFTGTELPDDVFFHGNFSLTFNSIDCDPKIKAKSLASDQGYVLNITATDCGAVLSNTTSSIVKVANKTFCLWKISVPPKNGDLVNIIIFTLKKENMTSNEDLRIYDGANVRTDIIANDTGSEIWSRTNSLIIIYKAMDISKSNFTIDYKTMGCNNTCKNGLCLHPDWLCNGKNDCGDFTDEIDCASVPMPFTTVAPPIAPVKEGVSATAFAITIIVMFALGVLAALIIPNLYQRYRNSRYSQFRDVSVIE